MEYKDLARIKGLKTMKKIKFIVIFTFGLFSLCFAAEESITITTYYPSPYGSYNELATNRLAVGDSNGSGGLDAADQPNRDGDIRLKPQTGDPTSWPAGTRGKFAYSSTQDSMYHHNGSAWVASGGGNACYVNYSSAVGSCRCPSGWTLKLDLGSWGDCHGTGYPTYVDCLSFRPPSGGCPSGCSGRDFGEGCLCCQ
jgi:hypothetical protein